MKMKKSGYISCLVFGLIVILLASISSPAFALYNYTPGSYATWNSGSLSQNIINNPGIVGVLASANWSGIETQDGVYNWSALDTKISAAQNAGFKVAIKLVASLDLAPGWLKNNANVQKINILDTNQDDSSFCQNQTLPVFWDPIFHEKKKALIRAAGARYANNPTVVAVMASFANTYTNDWTVPHDVGYISGCGVTVDQVTDWLNAGYTTDKMLNVGKEIIDTTAEAFPNQALKLPIAQTADGLDGVSTDLAEQIINYAYSKYPDRFFAQRNALSTKTSGANSTAVKNALPGTSQYIYKLLRDHRPMIGLQMLAAASNGDTDNCRQNNNVSPCPPYDVLLHSVNIGLAYNPRFLEYWNEDSANPDLYDVFTYATQTMTPPDTAPPDISSISVFPINPTSATINWTTNEYSDSQVEYGLDISYGSATSLDASMVTAHSQALSSLSPSATYHYRVKSKDAAGNPAVSGDYTFTTADAPDTDPPTGVAIISPSDYTSYTTPATVAIEASAQDNVGIAKVEFYDGITLKGTVTTFPYSYDWSFTSIDNGFHSWIAKAYDAAGNSAFSPIITLTVNIDDVSPSLSTVTPVPTPTNDTTPDFTFSTDEAGTITYGGSCGSSIYLASAGNNTITFNILSPGVHSNCTITVTDTFGNASEPLEVNSFTIDTTPPTIPDVSSSFTFNFATITWTTDEDADSQIEYGETQSYGSQTTLDSNKVTSHSQDLTNLIPSTLYHYQVKSQDAAGNETISDDYTFTTQAVPDTSPPSIPANLSASAVSYSQVNISWDASTDNVGVAGYHLYRDGMPLTTTSDTFFLDTAVSPSTTYYYTVTAYDASNNESSQTTPVFVDTPPRTYNNADFENLVHDWLQAKSSPTDINGDGIINSRDMGIMMSDWEGN